MINLIIRMIITTIIIVFIVVTEAREEEDGHQDDTSITETAGSEEGVLVENVTARSTGGVGEVVEGVGVERGEERDDVEGGEVEERGVAEGFGAEEYGAQEEEDGVHVLNSGGNKVGLGDGPEAIDVLDLTGGNEEEDGSDQGDKTNEQGKTQEHTVLLALESADGSGDKEKTEVNRKNHQDITSHRHFRINIFDIRSTFFL